jgi:hypothetical protein
MPKTNKLVPAVTGQEFSFNSRVVFSGREVAQVYWNSPQGVDTVAPSQNTSFAEGDSRKSYDTSDTQS